jgi:CPA2 family monovalent cation:H+ antiporter-2
VYRFSPDDWLSQSLQITNIASHAMAVDHHVLVCGFGHTGRNLCQLLEQEAISYIALDVNPEVVKSAVLDGHQVDVGDSPQHGYVYVILQAVAQKPKDFKKSTFP